MVFISKLLIILGLGMTFSGLICMIESKKITVPGGKEFVSSHTNKKPELDKIGWLLIISGYFYQIVGVIAS